MSFTLKRLDTTQVIPLLAASNARTACRIQEKEDVLSLVMAADMARDEAIASREASISEMDQMRADGTAKVRTY